MIFNMIVGGDKGGGADLNFSVVRYASESDLPETAVENTIAVITETEITNWAFDVDEPETLDEGMVWFGIGTSSLVEFNALKTNSVQIYPLCAKQYINGALVDVTAKTYQGGVWVDWTAYLFKDGNTFESLTGGWESTTAYTNSNYKKTPTLTFEDGKMKISLTGTANFTNGTVSTVNEIDLTGFSQLIFSCTAESNAQYSTMTCITIGVMDVTSTEQYSFIASAKPSVGDNVIDLSSVSGRHKIAINPMVSGLTATVEFDEIRLE